MRITQGTFSFLPDLSDQQIRRQISYAVERGWAISVEHTDDPHPRNVYWEMWGHPLFDLRDVGEAMRQVQTCRAAHGSHYVKVNAFDSTRGWETVRLSFLVQRPPAEPGFDLSRDEGEGRQVRYALRTRTR